MNYTCFQLIQLGDNGENGENVVKNVEVGHKGEPENVSKIKDALLMRNVMEFALKLKDATLDAALVKILIFI